MAYTLPPSRTDGVHTVAAADWNAYVRDNFIEVEARKRVDYVEITASVTISATTAAGATTIITATAFTPSGSDVYRVEWGCPDVSVVGNAGGNAVIFHLYEGATNLGRIGVASSAGTTTFDVPVYGSREFTPTNALKTYSIRGHRTNANCTVVAGAGGADTAFPTWMRITRLP